MAKKFIIAKSATPIEYRVVDAPPQPEPKGGNEPGTNTLVLVASSASEVTLSKVSLVVEPA